MDESRISWIEIVLLLAIVAMVVVIAKPGILTGRRSVNESEAAGALRTLVTVEAIYSNRHPATGFTCSLADLEKDGLLDPALASGTRSGYRLSSANCRADNTKSKAITDYEWYADPVNSETGTRHFCADQRKVIRASDSYSGHNCLVFGSEL
jgi:hypothetical protein